MNELPKTDHIKQNTAPVFGAADNVASSTVQCGLMRENSHTIVAEGQNINKPDSNVKDKIIDSRQAAVSADCKDMLKKTQYIKQVSNSERLEELKKCTLVGRKTIICTVALVLVSVGFVSVLKNSGNIFNVVDGVFESIATALANISGRLTRKQSVQQSNIIGGIINEMQSMICSDLNKDFTIEFLKSAGGKLCKNIDLSKLCCVAKNASILNEKFGINSYDQNALADLKFKLLKCIKNKKSDCSESLDILNGIKNKYFANECLEAVAASEIGKFSKLLDDKDLVKNSILYKLIANASNIAGFFSQTKNIIVCALISVGIPAVSIVSKTFFNVAKTVYNFFKTVTIK